jgi:hypothetical protein
MTQEDQELLLESIDEAFGFTKADFEKDSTGRLVPIYTKWGSEENYTDIEDLGHVSFKISKNLGDIYIKKIHTDSWVIVGEGTYLHCDDLYAGMGYVEDFEGYLL